MYAVFHQKRLIVSLIRIADQVYENTVFSSKFTQANLEKHQNTLDILIFQAFYISYNLITKRSGRSTFIHLS